MFHWINWSISTLSFFSIKYILSEKCVIWEKIVIEVKRYIIFQALRKIVWIGKEEEQKKKNYKTVIIEKSHFN